MGRSDYLEILDEAEALEKCVHPLVVPPPVHCSPRVSRAARPSSGDPILPPPVPFARGRAEIARG